MRSVVQSVRNRRSSRKTRAFRVVSRCDSGSMGRACLGGRRRHVGPVGRSNARRRGAGAAGAQGQASSLLHSL